MKVFIGILIFLAVITVITLIRAIFWVPKKKTYEPLEDEKVQLNEYRRNLSDAIKFKTVSQPDPKDVDWNEFEKFHKFLEERFPLVYKNLKHEEISDASLLFTWEGTRPDLEPIALLAHQDVVPIAAGTE